MPATMDGVECRTCLQSSSQYHSLEECVMETNVKLVEMLDATVPQILVTAPNKFSHTICSICCDKLLNSYKFQRMCIESNERLCARLGYNNKEGGALEGTFDPLLGVECIKLKQEESENVTFQCEINPEEILVDTNHSNGWENVGYGGNGKDMQESREESKRNPESETKKPTRKSSRRNSILPCGQCGKVINCTSCTKKLQRTEKQAKSRHKGGKKKKKLKSKESRENSSLTEDDNLSLALVERAQLHRKKEMPQTEDDPALEQECQIKQEQKSYQKHDKEVADEDFSTEDENMRSNTKRGHFPCAVCSEVFDRPYRLKRHSAVHSLERPHACELCSYRYPSSNSLKIHMMEHENEAKETSTDKSPTNGFQCPCCPRCFETHALLSAHRQIHAHTSPESDYACSVCQCNFVAEKALIEHITTRHSEMEKHKCDQCGKSFVLLSHLQEHITRHKENKEHLTCPICDKEFSHKHSLKEHMRSHKNDSSFLCPQCGKTFKTSSNLSQHMKRHFGLKQYPCPECPSRFNCRSDLIKHMSTHRKGKPHECDVCGSRFTRAYSLRKHKALHTGEKRYKCSECNTAFATNDHLRRHIRTHTGEKPYKCKYCDRSYAESGDLTKHIRKHIGQNTYMCDQCPLTFKYNAEFRHHVSEHYTSAHMQKMSAETSSQVEDNKNDK